MATKSVFVATLLSLIASPALAQTVVNPNDWSDHKEGLAVASSQKVTAKPTKLRLFATLAEADADIKKAVTRLADTKKATIDRLKSIDVKQDAVKISPTRILEWNMRDQHNGFFWRPDDVIRVPNQPPEKNTRPMPQFKWIGKSRI